MEEVDVWDHEVPPLKAGSIYITDLGNDLKATEGVTLRGVVYMLHTLHVPP